MRLLSHFRVGGGGCIALGSVSRESPWLVVYPAVVRGEETKDSHEFRRGQVS